ncbi:MAG: hypothetical protein J6C20_03750 [Paludibacteraceae bacterium]|nr:hypothetical protein [Paludibacteraceae bacterium]
MRSEELGINTFGPLGRVLLCAPMPRAVPMADGFCPCRGQMGAKRGDWEYAWIGLLEH